MNAQDQDIFGLVILAVWVVWVVWRFGVPKSSKPGRQGEAVGSFAISIGPWDNQKIGLSADFGSSDWARFWVLFIHDVVRRAEPEVSAGFVRFLIHRLDSATPTLPTPSGWLPGYGNRHDLIREYRVLPAEDAQLGAPPDFRRPRSHASTALGDGGRVLRGAFLLYRGHPATNTRGEDAPENNERWQNRYKDYKVAIQKGDPLELPVRFSGRLFGPASGNPDAHDEYVLVHDPDRNALFTPELAAWVGGVCLDWFLATADQGTVSAVSRALRLLLLGYSGGTKFPPEDAASASIAVVGFDEQMERRLLEGQRTLEETFRARPDKPPTA